MHGDDSMSGQVRCALFLFFFRCPRRARFCDPPTLSPFLSCVAVQIINKEGVKEANREDQGWVIKDGIVVVIKDSIIPSGTII